MRTTRVYVDQPLSIDSEFGLARETSRHVDRVLRLRPGASLVLFNGKGGEFDATLVRIENKAVFVQPTSFRETRRESPLTLRLGQGISRGARMDAAVQKAVELGVSHIDPVATEHSVVHLDADRAERRRAHWLAIAVNACEQCGRTQIPGVTGPSRFDRWIAQRTPEEYKLVLDGGANTTLADLESGHRSITLLIGPEGGLSEAEISAAVAAGFTAVSLGPRTLRTETAAVAGLTALQLHFGDLARAAERGIAND